MAKFNYEGRVVTAATKAQAVRNILASSARPEKVNIYRSDIYRDGSQSISDGDLYAAGDVDGFLDRLEQGGDVKELTGEWRRLGRRRVNVDRMDPMYNINQDFYPADRLDRYVGERLHEMTRRKATSATSEGYDGYRASVYIGYVFGKDGRMNDFLAVRRKEDEGKDVECYFDASGRAEMVSAYWFLGSFRTGGDIRKWAPLLERLDLRFGGAGNVRPMKKSEFIKLLGLPNYRDID